MKKLFIYNAFFFIIGGCKEKFTANIQSPESGYIVVEGFISSGPDPTAITLTRSVKLYDTINFKPEHNALVTIESENNEIFPLYETGDGVYTSGSLALNSAEKYHLHIATQDNKQYVSDFAAVKKTPDIDSVSWKRENGGVRIYINTHDPQNNTRYYHWKYEETWEFHSAYQNSIEYVYDQSHVPIAVRFRFADQSVDTTIYKCWNTVNSTNINLGSSEKLSEDLIYLPLIYIDPASIKLSVLYSINVRQYALSHEAYLFLEKIKKNTENVGSIFDAQPSELQGNIHCTTNPDEIVVGYVDISEEKQKRIFIRNNELPGWNYRTDCLSVTIDNNADSIYKYGFGLFPTTPFSVSRGIDKFNATYEERCVNCTFSGTNMRPPFWP